MIVDSQLVSSEGKLDSVLVYPGGKATIREWIVSQMPKHINFVDVFGGGGSISFYKKPSKVDIYNDIGMVSLFFAVMRDEYLGAELYDLLSLTPFSEDEFQYCNTHWRSESNPMEQLRQWYVQILQCFTHEEDGKGWIGIGTGVSGAKSFMNHVEMIPVVSQRLRSMQITNRHFKDLIPLFDNPDTLFYCDPPYMGDKKVEVGYADNMTHKDHVTLLDLITNCKGQVMLSGYDNDLYRSKLGDWEHKELTRKSMVAKKQAKIGGEITERTEHLWIKRNTDAMHAEQKSQKVTRVKKDEREADSLWAQETFSWLS